MPPELLTLDSVLGACRLLAGSGAALHWLRPAEKRPISENWSSAPVHTLESLRASHPPGANIGIRLGEPSKTPSGYIHLIDLDIRDATKAHAAHAKLAELLQEYNTMPEVMSGSGGESRHYYFVTDRPFRKTKLAKSSTHSMVFDWKLKRDVKKNDWEIDLLGTGSQAVIPPSIHPDTGRPYRWLRDFDYGALELGIGPFIPSDRIENLGATRDDDADMFAEDDDDLLREWRTAPLDLTEDEVADTIENLPDEWVEDRDAWVTVGAAIHHQTGGSETGFEKWCEWSQNSEKYDPKTQKSVWKSFRGNSRPVTMRTLIQAANETRLKSNLPDLTSAPLEAEKGAESGHILTVSTPKNAHILDEDGALSALLGTNSLPDGPSSTEIGHDWTSLLDRTDEGHPKGVLHNISLVLEHDLRTRGILAINEFTHEIVLVASPKAVTKRRESSKPPINLTGALWEVKDTVNGVALTDSHDHAMRRMIEAPKTQGGYGVKVSDRDLKASVDSVANLQRFHPIRAYLEECARHHDGKFGRCERLYVDYLGAGNTEYHREAATLFCIGAVTRAFEPGHKFDFVPILEGVQGKRKSTFISILARDWFAELTGDFHNTAQMVEMIQGAWIIEIPELQGFSRADTNTLKGFISRNVDRARLAYDRRARNFPRQCVFTGTTNDDAYLRDHTGGRRFWPIKCDLAGPIDTERLIGEVDMIWGEAMILYREMRKECRLKELPLYLRSKGAVAEAERLQESRRVDTVEDALASRIEEWANEPIGAVNEDDELDPMAPQKRRDNISAIQVWVEMEGGDPSKFGPAEASRYGKALARVKGFQKSPERAATRKYGRQWVYARG